jgi:amino acid permease
MKDSIEEVRGKGKFSKKENIAWTLIIVMICCAISCAFTSIGTVTTILGATTNSAIGFLLPVAFYLKVEKKTSPWTNTKIMAYILFVFICISSVITLTLVITKMINGTGDEQA